MPHTEPVRRPRSKFHRVPRPTFPLSDAQKRAASRLRFRAFTRSKAGWHALDGGDLVQQRTMNRLALYGFIRRAGGTITATDKLHNSGLPVFCRVCGCTDDRACPGGCCWVEPDLCSACVRP